MNISHDYAIEPAYLAIYLCESHLTPKPLINNRIMKQIRILALTVAVIFFAASCSKGKGDKPTGDASIKGKWNISHTLTIEPNNDEYNYDGKAGDYMEFKEDGSLFTKVGDYENAENYEIIDATHIKKGGYDAELKELTNNKCVLFVPHHDGQPENITYTITK